jgi:hypothetical protein
MLTLPLLLTEMIAAGRWPRNSREAMAQNNRPLVTRERLRAVVAEEDWLYLHCPPFHTVRELSLRNWFWTDPMANPDGIAFDLAIEIGDFGLGSDAPILLDYRQDPNNPRVIRLKWSRDGNHWVEMSPDLNAFVNLLGL